MTVREQPLSTLSRRGALCGEAARGSWWPAGPLCSDLIDVSAGILGPLGQGVKERPFRVLSRTPGQELKEAGVSFRQVALALSSPPDRATNPLNKELNWASINGFCEQLNEDFEG